MASRNRRTLDRSETAATTRTDAKRELSPRRVGRVRQSRRVQPWLPYVFLMPALIFEIIVHFGPMILGVGMSFLTLAQFEISHWWQAPLNGFGNYSVALSFSTPTGSALLQSFVVSIGYTVIVLAVSWVFGLAGATFLHRAFRGRALLRSFYLIPYALPAYAAVITWRFILDRDSGLLNHVLVDQFGLFGGNRPFWLIGGNAFWAECIVAIWRTWPFAFLILMAGMQSISTDIFEASSIDGASPWRQLRSVTLPLLGPVNEVLIIVLFLWTFNDFNTPFILFGGTPPASADLISIHIYNNSFVTWNFGLGSAMSVLLLLFLLVVTGVYLLIIRRRNRDA